MIAKCCGTGASFMGLARYLESGKKGQNQERVLWSEGLNMGSSDPIESARLMAGAANENSRCEKPVYHFSINWHPEEAGDLTREQALEIGKATLADLGLSHHQALMVAHEDTEHFHVHVMVNRINPVTRLSWKQGLSKMALEKTMARLSLEQGFEIVPGHHNYIDLGIEPPDRSISMTTEELRFKERTGKMSNNELAAHATMQAFEKANSWKELHEGLNGTGWKLLAQGRGLILESEEGAFVKPSSISRDFSRGKLEKAFGEPFAKEEPKLSQVKERRETPSYEDAIKRFAAPQIKEAESWLDLQERVRKLGLEVRPKGRGLVLTDGANEIKMSDLGRSYSAPALERRFGKGFSEGTKKGHYQGIIEGKRAALKLDKAVRELDQWHLDRKRLDSAIEEYTPILDKTQLTADFVREMGTLRKGYEEQWLKVFRDPDKAREKFAKFIEKNGHKEALRAFAKNAGRFGKVHGGALFSSPERKQALGAQEKFIAQYRDWRIMAQDAAQNREAIDRDMKLRNRSPLKKEIEGLIKKVGKKETTRDFKRGQLEKAVLAAAKGLSKEEMRALPLMSELRRRVVQKTVASLNKDAQELYFTNYMLRQTVQGGPDRAVSATARKQFLDRHKHSDQEITAELPTTATPSEQRAFAAVARFADLRRKWLKETIERVDTITHATAIKQQMDEAGAKVAGLGRGARKWLRPFGLTPKTKRPVKYVERVKARELNKNKGADRGGRGRERELVRKAPAAPKNKGAKK